MSNSKWNLSSQGHALDQLPLLIAEPLPRIPPPGITNMISLRHIIPKSPSQNIQDICSFYLQKCSGKYEQNQITSRYLHSMVEEILSQLSGISEEVKRNRLTPEAFQACLDEWNVYFPSSLHTYGTSPKEIAYFLKTQESEITQLKNHQTKMIKKHQEEIEELLLTMNQQLTAYKESVLLERQHRKYQLEELMQQAQQEIEEVRRTGITDREALQQEHEVQLARLHHSYSDTLTSLQDELQRQQQQWQSNYQLTLQKKEKHVELAKERFNEMKSLYRKLYDKHKLLLQQLVVRHHAGSGDNDILHDELDREMEAIELAKLDDDDDDQENKKDGVAHEVEQGSGGSGSVGSSPDGKVNRRRRRSSIIPPTQVRNADEEAYYQLQQTHLMQSAQLTRCEEEIRRYQMKEKTQELQIQSLNGQIVTLLEERQKHLSRLDELEDLVQTLQRALSMKVIQDNEQHQQHCPSSLPSPCKCQQREGMEEKKEKDDKLVLCHTPHFLDKADRYGPMRGKQRVKGYMISGHY